MNCLKEAISRLQGKVLEEKVMGSLGMSFGIFPLRDFSMLQGVKGYICVSKIQRLRFIFVHWRFCCCVGFVR